VIRILDPSSARMGIDALGYDPIEKERLLKAIHRPYGMILVTGPTGSGKTVSLYSCLNLLNQPGVNIATAEDPSEINMPGVNQVNVNEKAGLTFAVALKSFLRQDPDIIMVGEIRDLETADIAIKAAQTGHMVLSTLHTNDAPTTLTRLRNMGVAPFNIASSVILIYGAAAGAAPVPQMQDASRNSRSQLAGGRVYTSQLDGTWKPYKAVGCDACNNGYKGRVGIYPGYAHQRSHSGNHFGRRQCAGHCQTGRTRRRFIPAPVGPEKSDAGHYFPGRSARRDQRMSNLIVNNH
jgi:type IV pilus assembly protein PilB